MPPINQIRDEEREVIIRKVMERSYFVTVGPLFFITIWTLKSVKHL